MIIYLTYFLSCYLLVQSRIFQTATIVATNDIHGVAFPIFLTRTDNNQTYKQGGLAYLADMIKTVQRQNQGNVLYLDAGDQFQGSIESSSLISNGSTMNQFYNHVKLDAWAIGNHEFDYAPDFLNQYIEGKNKNIIELSANLKDVDGVTTPLLRQKNSKLFTLRNGLKIGVIGLTTVQTLTSTTGFTNHIFPDYKFLNYSAIVQTQSKILKEQGANAVLLLCHVGNFCDANQTFGFWKEDTPQSSKCDPKDQISTLLNDLPRGTVDAVLQGHRHVFSHHFINGVPVVGSIDRGLYFNILHLKFYNKIIYDRTIQGPIPVCQKIFENYKNCKYLTQDELKKAGDLVNWKFHQKQVQADAYLQQLYNEKWVSLLNQYLQPLLDNQDGQLYRQNAPETKLGNLITNLLHRACPNLDIIIVNIGVFRSRWPQGIIQYQHLYDMIPFNNSLISFDMNGKELLQTLSILQASDKTYYPTYGLKIYIKQDRNGSKSFINATLTNGTVIQNTINYRVGSSDFLLQGGDDFIKVMNKVYTLRNNQNQGNLRDLLKQQMKNLKKIQSGTLIDPLNPRVIIIKNDEVQQ